MILSDRSMCTIPHQGIRSPLSSLFLIRLFGGAQGRGWRGSILVLHILQTQQTRSNRENKSYNQIKMCMCVEFFWMELTPLSAWLYLYFEIWAIFSFLFFFFFSLFFMLLGTYIFFLLHSPYLFAWWIWRIMSKGWSIFVWMEGMFLRNFQCRSQHMSSWVVKSRQTNSDAPES